MRALSRLLQVVGLAALPLAMVLQLAGGLTLGQMLILAVAGAAAFWIGRILEGYATR